MPLHSPGKRRERALVYGRSNSGKSSTWQDIAAWRKKSSAQFEIHVGDTDHSADVIEDAYDDFCHVADLRGGYYEDWIKWAKETAVKVKRDDWVVVDMVDKAWMAAQDYYWSKMGFDLLADVYLANTLDIDNKSKDAFHMAGDHGVNWGNINFYYKEFFSTVMNMPCHVLCTSHAKEVTDRDKAEVRAQFKVGWRPTGPGSEQNELANYFHTVLFCAETGPNKWVMTTVREKKPLGTEGRRMLKGEKMEGFVMNYLVGVAGWSL
jgi:hypothetical protein